MPAHKAVKHDEWLILLHRTAGLTPQGAAESP